MRRAVLVVIVLAVAARPTYGRTFADVLGRRPITRPIGEAMAQLAARALPQPAASPGVTFTFDPATHAFVRSVGVEGQLYLEHARPIGRGRINVSLSGSWFGADTIDGNALDTLSDPGPPIVDPDTGATFRLTRFALGLDVQQVSLMGTFGVTDGLEVAVALPVLVSCFSVDAQARAVGSPTSQHAHSRTSHTGVGDVVISGKQRIVRGWPGELALGIRVRAPSGDEDYFQGLGYWEVAHMLYASTASWHATPAVAFRAHLNGGVAINTSDSDSSAALIGIGIDALLGARATLAIAFLAREPFAGIAPPGSFNVLRRSGSGVQTSSPLLGLDRGRAPTQDVNLAARVVLWRETLIGFVGVTLPINRAGLRADVIPIVGVEAGF